MITEDYCSYEVAKLLKDKGFDGECYCHEFTDYEGNFTTYHTDYSENWNQSESCVSIPTLGMAMKWLREKKIFIRIIESVFGESFRFEVYCNNAKLLIEIDHYIDKQYENSYEEAVEAALKYTLENLI